MGDENENFWDSLGRFNPPPKVRLALYSIGGATGVLLSAYGFMDDVTWSKWMVLFGAMLGLAGANVSTADPAPPQ